MSELVYACLYQPPSPGTVRVPAEPGDRSRDPTADRPADRPTARPTGRTSDRAIARMNAATTSAATNTSAPSVAARQEAAGPGARQSALAGVASGSPLLAVAEAFSPRYEQHRHDVVVIDVSGLDRLIGPPRVIADELRRDAANRGLHVHVAIAATRVAALVLAHARPGVTVVDPGHEATALAPLPIRILEQIDHHDEGTRSSQSPQTTTGHYRIRPLKCDRKDSAISAIAVFQQWGLKTVGELAALPAADLRARLGPEGLRWQAMARGEDVRPLVPSCADERFTSAMELEWPIEGAEPLSFVLTRLLEPLSTRLERRDRGAAALHVHLRLVTKEVHARRLQLPSPLRDVRTLRTLALLDLESHPPAAAIDHVAITIDPTPARILQHTLFTRALPTPEQLTTLLARLGALMGEDRIGAPATIDSYRPGAFAMKPFATDHEEERRARRDLDQTNDHREHGAHGNFLKNVSVSSVSSRLCSSSVDSTSSGAARCSASGAEAAVVDRDVAPAIVSALRRCRQPVPARVAVGADERPSRVTTDRRGFAGGSVVHCAGPWRTSGAWWECGGGSARPGGKGPGRTGIDRAGRPGEAERAARTREAAGAGAAGGWSRDEWDVALSDGAVYRIFRDRVTEGWFIDAIVD